MKTFIKGAAKCLIFSLLALSALGGCAVYPANPGPYAYGTDVNGQAVYAAPPVYAAPYYYDPVYVGPPVFFNFGFSSWGGHGGGGRGFGHGGGHGGGRR